MALTVIRPASADQRLNPEKAFARAAPDVAPAPGQFYSMRGRVATALVVNEGATATVKIAGVAGLPASGVASVALNVAVDGSVGSGSLAIYPSGSSTPRVDMGYGGGSTYTQTLLMVKVGSDGFIKLTNTQSTKGGTIKLYLDVHGYTLTSQGAVAGSTLVPLRPARIAHVTVPANNTVQVKPLGKGGIPSTGVTHAVLTITAKNSTPGRLAVYPTGAARPNDFSLEYGKGASGQAVYFENQVFAKVGTGGEVTFYNSGSAAVSVDIDAVGYFAAPDTAVVGSTVHPIGPARIVDNVSIPANATHDFSPLGQGGVPATGVTGVYINLSAVDSALKASGALRVFPKSANAVNVHTVSVSPDDGNNGSLVARPGEDGRITVHNASNAAISLSVDAYAYFKPAAGGCTSAAQRLGAGGPSSWRMASAVADIPVRQFTRTAAVQSSPASSALGTLEYAYTDNYGRLLHGHQKDPGNFASVQWTAISGSESFTGQPALGEQADGRLQVMAQHTSSAYWGAAVTAKNEAGWNPWTNWGGALASAPGMQRYEDTLVTFAVDATSAGGLWAIPQFGANDPYREWLYLGMNQLSSATTPVAVPVREGLRIFVLDQAGVWRTALYSRGLLSQCASISEPGFSGQPAVVTLPGGKTQIFVRDANGHIVTKKQDDSGAFPGAWQQVGTGTFTAIGDPSVVMSPVTGRLEVIARGADEGIYSTGETVQASGEWRAWKYAQEDGDYVPATNPTAFTYVGTNGPVWGYTFRSSGNASRFYEVRETTSRARTAAPGTPAFVGHSLPKPPASRR